MTADQIWGVVRTILAAFSGIAVSKGYIDEATLTSLIGAAGVIFVAVWSVISKRFSTA
jgi:hypothetical protein